MVNPCNRRMMLWKGILDKEQLLKIRNDSKNIEGLTYKGVEISQKNEGNREKEFKY